MSFITITNDQRSDAWRLARVGRLTGSCAVDMMATVKKGEAAARRDLRAQLVCERLTGQPQEDNYVSKEMQRGIDRESEAFAAYEVLTGRVARKVGFLAHPELMAGCSPDGEVRNFKGLVELKCPKSATHLHYLRTRKAPAEHLPQIIHNLWITGASWCDFVSFDDRFPPGAQLLIVRVERNEAEIASYELLARQFLSEVDRDVADVRQMLEGVAA